MIKTILSEIYWAIMCTLLFGWPVIAFIAQEVIGK